MPLSKAQLMQLIESFSRTVEALEADQSKGSAELLMSAQLAVAVYAVPSEKEHQELITKKNRVDSAMSDTDARLPTVFSLTSRICWTDRNGRVQCEIGG